MTRVPSVISRGFSSGHSSESVQSKISHGTNLNARFTPILGALTWRSRSTQSFVRTLRFGAFPNTSAASLPVIDSTQPEKARPRSSSHKWPLRRSKLRVTNLARKTEWPILRFSLSFGFTETIRSNSSAVVIQCTRTLATPKQSNNPDGSSDQVSSATAAAKK